MDHYSTLGVNKDASAQEIKSAYRNLAKEHHPDAGGNQEKFQQISNAYETLSNPDKRAEYNVYGDNPQPRGQPRYSSHHVHINPEDMFANFFAGGRNPFGGRHGHPGQYQQQNRNIRIAMEISLEDTLDTCEKTLKITTPAGMEQNVEVKLPKGAQTGMIMRYPGLGDNTFEELPRGELMVEIHVREHPQFKRAGPNLGFDIEINSIEAILGSSTEITTLSGKTIKVTIPAGTQYGTQMRIAGHGTFHTQSAIQGDLFVTVLIKTPTNLTAEQKAMLKQINE